MEAFCKHHCAIAMANANDSFCAIYKDAELSLTALTARLAIRCIIVNYCTRWRCNFKGLSQEGGRADLFQKNSAPLSLMTTYRMIILAGSISLDKYL